MYEVYALKYGERDTTTCQFFYREPKHDPLTLHYFVWLIVGGPHPVLVDTGFLEDDARARQIRNYVSPATVVERMGVRAADVPMALISHLHYDHWAGHSLFPNAEHWIQAEEVAFWTGPYAATPAFRGSANVPALADLVTLNYANRMRIVNGDREIAPGIRVYRVGGHTAGLQIVTVETSRGTVVLTSDASHFYRNVETRQPVQIITSLPEMLAAFETIDRLAGTGKLILANAATAGDAAKFNFDPATGCAKFPELKDDVVGETFKGRGVDQPVLGFADVHVHVSATTFLGGAHYGAPFHRFGVTQAVGNCESAHGPDGRKDIIGNFLANQPAGTHDTQGRPTFHDWPGRDSLTHEATYYKWIERAWKAGLRILVNDLVENEALCQLQRENAICQFAPTRLIFLTVLLAPSVHAPHQNPRANQDEQQHADVEDDIHHTMPR